MNRLRGGASHKCPTCGSNTRVRTTWRTEGGKVSRERECLGRRKHRYFTTEEFVGKTGEVGVQRHGGVVEVVTVLKDVVVKG